MASASRHHSHQETRPGADRCVPTVASGAARGEDEINSTVQAQRRFLFRNYMQGLHHCPAGCISITFTSISHKTFYASEFRWFSPSP